MGGHMNVGKIEVSDLSHTNVEVGYVPQENIIRKDLTVREVTILSPVGEFLLFQSSGRGELF
jgi:ABC-type Mn2+/Zn2+ transport system ATPase subunit